MSHHGSRHTIMSRVTDPRSSRHAAMFTCSVAGGIMFCITNYLTDAFVSGPFVLGKIQSIFKVVRPTPKSPTGFFG